jgi:hypothetical protein
MAASQAVGSSPTSAFRNAWPARAAGATRPTPAARAIAPPAAPSTVRPSLRLRQSARCVRRVQPLRQARRYASAYVVAVGAG